MGAGPFVGEVFRESVKKLQLGGGENLLLLLLKAAVSAFALIFLLFVVLGF
jgi:hypothetical protein